MAEINYHKINEMVIREEWIIFNEYNNNTICKRRIGKLFKSKTKKEISLLYLRQNEAVLQLLTSTPAM